MASSRPASSAGPGTRSASGSSDNGRRRGGVMHHTIPHTLCYLNGEYLPLDEAKVSVLDRGFVFGDGLYEGIPVYGLKLFRFDEHLARLGRSCAKLRIANPHNREQWLERCRKLIAALHEHGGATDQLLYI